MVTEVKLFAMKAEEVYIILHDLSAFSLSFAKTF